VCQQLVMSGTVGSVHAEHDTRTVRILYIARRFEFSECRIRSA
jgi:hypothetical protein